MLSAVIICGCHTITVLLWCSHLAVHQKLHVQVLQPDVQRSSTCFSCVTFLTSGGLPGQLRGQTRACASPGRSAMQPLQV